MIFEIPKSELKFISDKLVAYFSEVDNTKPLAGYADDILNAKSYEIVPEDVLTY